jgi:hypothetical protein
MDSSFSSIRLIVMGIVHEEYFLVFPVDPVHQDVLEESSRTLLLIQVLRPV